MDWSLHPIPGLNAIANARLQVVDDVLSGLAIANTAIVADQAAMLGLIAQKGATVVRQDRVAANQPPVYLLVGDDPAQLANWMNLTAAAAVVSVAGRSGTVVLSKGDVGLDQVNNTSDAAKPISGPTQTALDTLNARSPQNVVEPGLAVAFVDAAGQRTWLEATDTDGGPSTYAASKVAEKAGAQVLAAGGLVRDDVQAGASVIIADAAGVVTWLQANDTDGGPTPYAQAAIGRSIAVTEPARATYAGRRNWELALADGRDTRPLIWVWMGASTSAGVTGQEFDKHVTQIEKMLQSSYNPRGVRGGFTNKVRSSFTGSLTEVLQSDLKQMVEIAAGASVSYTATKQRADGFELFFSEGPSYGPFTVTINGTSYTVTPDTTGTDDRPSGVWRSPLFTRGFPTITITAGSTKARLMTFRLEDGDRDLGVRVYNGSLAGMSTTRWITPSEGDTWWSRVNRLQPDVIAIQLGTNDINDGNSVALYESNLQTLINRAKTEVTTRKLWIPMVAQQSTQPQFGTYREAMRRVAAANPDVATFHSYWEFFPTTPAEYAASTDGLYQSDMTHPTNRGSKFIGQLLARSFGLPSLITWPAD